MKNHRGFVVREDALSSLIELNDPREFRCGVTSGGRVVINQARQPGNPTLSIEEWRDLNRHVEAAYARLGEHATP